MRIPSLTGSIADTLVARQVLNRADREVDSAHYEIANLGIDSALTILKKYLASDTLTARAYNLKSEILIKYLKSDSAVAYADTAEQIAKQNIEEGSLIEAQAQTLKGLAYFYAGEYDASISSTMRALELRKKLLGDENHRLIKGLYNNLGIVYGTMGNHNKALVCFRKSLGRGELTSLRQVQAEVTSLNNLAITCDALGEFSQAIRYAEEALSLLKQHFTAEHPAFAMVYGNLAGLYDKLGAYAQGLVYARKGLQICLKNFGEKHPRVAGNQMQIGNIYISLGDYERALSYYTVALSNRKETLGGDHPQVAEGYHNIGIAYSRLGKFDEAIASYEEALRIKLEKFGKWHESTSSTINVMGIFYAAHKEYHKALSKHQEALTIQKKVLAENHPNVADTHEYIGFVLSNQGRPEQALAHFDTALSIRLHYTDSQHPKIAQNYANRLNLWLIEGKVDSSLKYSNRAYQILGYSKNKPDDFSQVTDLRRLKRVMDAELRFSISSKAGTVEKSVSAEIGEKLNRYLLLEDYMLQWYAEGRSGQYYLAESVPIYERVIDKFSDEGAPSSLPQTFLIAEKTKARQLAEQVQLSLHETSFGLPDSLRQQEHRLNVDLAYYEKKAYQEEFDSEAPNDSLLRSYRDRIFSLKEQRDALIERFRRDYPDYYQLRYGQAVIGVAGVQDSLLTSDDQALLEYFVGDSAIYAFLLRRDTLVVRKIERDFPLEQWVEELRCGLFAGRVPAPRCAALSPDSARALYARRAHALYQKLVAPLDSLLPEGSLTLVPDGVLGYLPFEALLRQVPRPEDDFFAYDYWLRHCNLSYAYSATLQQYMRAKCHRQAPEPTVLAMAPHFEGEPGNRFIASRFIDTTLRRNQLSGLLYNEEEVRRIGRMVRADTLTDSTATREAFLAKASYYQVLHLATHGKANDQAGDNSFLAFYIPPDDSAAEPLLYNRELYNLDLNADLVVLSACETGIGELQRGEGIISLARGFSYAGAKSIVTSLWSVNDQATQVLMTHFYQGLRAGLPKHEALRQAKLRLLQSDNAAFHSPFFWAAFIPIGDMEPVELAGPGEGPWLEWLLMGGLALLGLGLWGRSFARRG